MPPIMKKILYILLFLPLAGFGQNNYSLSFEEPTDRYEIEQRENSNSKNKLIFVKIKKA